MKITALIPAYNEERNIARVIQGVRKYSDDIIVVDDGSSDSTYQIAGENGARVYRHIINRGLGGALGTGIKAVLLMGADILITLDADGQHDPEEIPKLLEPIQKREADIVIGSRFLENQEMPLFRKAGNYFFNLFTFSLFGVKTTDSQSGFRAFTRDALKKIEIFTSGMEVSSEIFKEIKKHNLRIKEVPIRAIYTDYSLSKGQGFRVGLRTLRKLITLKFIK